MDQVKAEVEGKLNKRRRPQAHGSYTSIVLGAAVVAVLIAAISGWAGIGLAQQAASAADVPSRTREIVAHLNSVIQFYRASTQPVQKAGEPNDVVYRDQAVTLSSQIAGFAFQSAKAEANVMAASQSKNAAAASSGAGEQQRLQTAADNAEKQIQALQDQETALNKQIASAKPKALPALQAEKKQIRGALDLENAMKDALQKIVNMSDAVGTTGLAADIERLRTSVPELQTTNKIASPQLITIDSARSAGVTSQGTVLLDLIETRHALDALLHQNDELHQQALSLRTPLSKALRALIQQGQQLTQQASAAVASPPVPAVAAQPGSTGQPAAPAAPAPGQTPIESITTQFKALSVAAVPLSQEIIVLEQSRANILAWQTSVNREYDSILHTLLLRLLVIAFALGLILGGGEVWKIATNKYIRDIRRRRQLLIVRRVVVGFLSVIVIVFGFVTQFNSLATFAGFITAGIAVGLQTILLSVAAYFFIIGRYGVKVGDRITISSVTGDVIDVGLVRFYMMELAGSATDLHPTGRVAVFSNAVLFQAGTPLYKQVPGTEYAWHELIVKLADGANYTLVCEAVLKVVHAVFEEYRTSIEQQHRGVEALMQIPIDPPVVESRLQYNAGAFQLWVRLPVRIRQASATDEKLTQAVAALIAANPEIKAAVASNPIIQASVRG